MDRVAILLSAVVPAIALLGYGVVKSGADWRHEALWTAFLVGAVAAIPAVVVELALGPALNLVPRGFRAAANALIAAVPEESLKYIVLVGMAEQHVDVRRLQDIVPLALAVSLGFAALENLFYLAAPGDWTSLAMARALTAVPGHGIFGLTMGALVTAARLRPGRSIIPSVAALVLPIALHAAYDFPLFAMRDNAAPLRMLGLVWAAAILVSGLIAIRLCNRMLRKAAEADRESGRDTQSGMKPIAIVLCGLALLVIGPLLASAFLSAKGTQGLWAGLPLGILPLMLGFDLVRTGLRRRKDLRAVSSPKAERANDDQTVGRSDADPSAA